MLKVRLNLRKVVAIATCLAVTTMFSGCDDEKEDAKVPVLTTAEASAITANGAVSGGNVTSDGGSEVTERGVFWGTVSSDLAVSGSKTSDGAGTGSFTSTLAGLTANTTYYVCAYATNSAGTAYGNVVSFTTAAVSEKVKLVKTMYDPYSMSTYQFEYDHQNRIKEITRVGSKYPKYTLTYSGDDLIKVNYEHIVRYTHIEDGEVTYEDVEINNEIVYVKNGTTITGPDIEYDYKTYTISLNNDALPAKIVFDEGPYEYTFKYQDGNVTEMTSSGTGKDELTKITKYDDKKSPFYHCKTPKWFYWVFFQSRYWEFLCQNNPTEANGTFTSDGYKYDYSFKYVYDDDGYITKRYWDDEYDDEYNTITFTYK